MSNNYAINVFLKIIFLKPYQVYGRTDGRYILKTFKFAKNRQTLSVSVDVHLGATLISTLAQLATTNRSIKPLPESS